MLRTDHSVSTFAVFTPSDLRVFKPQANLTPQPSNHHHIKHHVCRVESCGYHVRSGSHHCAMLIPDTGRGGVTNMRYCSYNRYLAVASRVVRRSLKEEQRIKAEKRGEQELRFAKWEVRT